MMRVAQYEQTATGQFHMRAVPNNPHCGREPGLVEIQYRIHVKYNELALDKDGFLLDNLWFSDYFEPLKHSRLTVSCENLATLIARDIGKVLSGRLCHCHAIFVSLSAIPNVWVSCICASEAQVAELMQTEQIPSPFGDLE